MSLLGRVAKFLFQPERPRRPHRVKDDGYITEAHLERHLPAELPFRGRVLKREIRLMWGVGQRRTYEVTYSCEDFFNCHPAVRPWYPKVKLAEQYGEIALRLTEQTHEHLGGTMTFALVSTEQLPEVLRRQLKRMYEDLERHAEQEVAQGCLLRPGA